MLLKFFTNKKSFTAKQFTFCFCKITICLFQLLAEKQYQMYSLSPS